jgi:hypothetical protein
MYKQVVKTAQPPNLSPSRRLLDRHGRRRNHRDVPLRGDQTHDVILLRRWRRRAQRVPDMGDPHAI